jgi:diguanylate cyclase (GGDEF)-like protein/PAS domain S-box-containing protein
VASYASVDLAGRIAAARRMQKLFWIAVGSIAMGSGIWAMHYIGMLAFILPVPVLYHYPTVIASLLLSCFGCGISLAIVTRKLSFASASVASLVMGGGIAGVHYLGMEAMRLPAMMEYVAPRVVLSVVVAVAVSFVALLQACRFKLQFGFQPKLASAILMGLAIPMMHYTGMWAVSFRSCSLPFSTSHTIHISALGIVIISVSTLVVLLLAMLVAFYDRMLTMQQAVADAARDGEIQFKTLAEAIPQIVWTADADGETTYINQRWYEMTGTAKGTGKGSDWMESVHPDDRETCRKKWKEAVHSGKTFEIEYRLRDARKEFRWYLDRAVSLRDAAGVIKQWFGTCTDIDDQKQNEQKLQEQIRQHTAALVEANAHLATEMQERTLAQQELNEQSDRMVRELTRRSNRVTLLVKSSELLQSCSDHRDVFSVVSGMATKIFPDLRGAVLLFGPSNDALEVATSWGDCRPTAASFLPQDCWALRTGHTHFVAAGDPVAQCKHVSSEDTAYLCLPLISQGKSIGVLHFQMIEAGEIAESVLLHTTMFAEQVGLSIANLRLREALHEQSIRDPLTGLFNRRYLEETLEREVRRAARSRDSLSVLMIDLDHFKRFNDTNGHEAGDAILRATAALLGRSVRAEDIVCRFGGEEFVIILPTADTNAAHARAEQIRVQLRNLTVLHQGRPLGEVTASAGVATFPLHGSTPQLLLDAADAALYRAKAEGRDRVVDAVSLAKAETQAESLSAASL